MLPTGYFDIANGIAGLTPAAVPDAEYKPFGGLADAGAPPPVDVPPPPVAHGPSWGAIGNAPPPGAPPPPPVIAAPPPGPVGPRASGMHAPTWGDIAPPPPPPPAVAPATGASPDADPNNTQIRTGGFVGGTAAHEQMNKGKTELALLEGANATQGAAADLVHAEKVKQLELDRALASRQMAALEDTKREQAARAQDERDKRHAVGQEIDALTTEQAAIKAPDMSTPTGIGPMLMMALGGLFTKPGEENPALTAYKNQVNVRVAKAKAAHENVKGRIDAKKGTYARLVDEGGVEAADALLKATMLKQGLNELEQGRIRNGIAEDNQHYIQTRGNLQAELLKTQAGAIDYVQAKAGTAKPDLYYDDRVGGGKVGMTREQMVALEMADRKNGAENGDKAAKDDADRRGRFVATGPNGEGYLAPTADEGKDDRNANKAREAALPMLETLAGKIEKLDAGDIAGKKVGYSTDAVLSLQSNTKQVMDQLRLMAKGGSLDNGMVEHLGELLGGDPTAVRANRAGIAKAIREVQSSMRSGVDANRRGSGGQNATQSVTKDKRGNVIVDPRGRAATGAPDAAMPKSFK